MTIQSNIVSDNLAAIMPTVSTCSIVPIKKFDEELQLIYGEVYAPGIPDSQGDFMSAKTIREMAHEFLAQGQVNNIDIEHNRELSGCAVVESFIAREDDTIFIPGSWVLGVKINDAAVWNQIKKGELNGFSIDGEAVRIPSRVTLDIPHEVRGLTSEVNGHTHEFVMYYDDEGNFLGGETDKATDDHFHTISRGTITDEALNHTHRFSFIESILHAQNHH